MTDPDEADAYNQDDYNSHDRYHHNYVGFHPFFDDLPKPINNHRRKETNDLQSNQNFIRELERIPTSYR